MVLGPALGIANSAAAEPRGSADRGELRRQLVELQRRAHELEEKIRRVEAELAREAPVRAVAPRSLAAARSAAAADCTVLPLYIDSTGIKHLRAECTERASQPSCDPPYALDEQGVRRFRPACTSDTAVRSFPTDD
jgi:hypothetical protein